MKNSRAAPLAMEVTAMEVIVIILTAALTEVPITPMAALMVAAAMVVTALALAALPTTARHLLVSTAQPMPPTTLLSTPSTMEEQIPMQPMADMLSEYPSLMSLVLTQHSG